MKDKALRYEEHFNNNILEYRKDQEFFSKRPFEASSMRVLISSVKKADVTYLGDFHTYDQNVRNLIRIIKSLVKGKNKFIIGLEMVMTTDQKFLDAFLDGFITELEFLESINYSESWRFPWTHYQVIFNLAKEHKLEMLALNSEGSLHDRDEHCADLLEKEILAKKGHSFLVLFGELHILPNKIPNVLNSRFKNRTISQTIIHQNLDDPYWAITESDDDSNDFKVIEFSKNEFCIFSSPPWMKYESMCYWYECMMDDPDFDLHEYIIEKGLKIFNDSTVESFSWILSQLIKILSLDADHIDIHDYNLYDHSKMEFIEKIIMKKKSTHSFYRSLLEHNKSFHLLGTNSMYCSNYSVNRLIKLAGNYLFNLFRQEESTRFLGAINDSDSKLRFFHFFCSQNIFSYFFCRVINPFVKCDLFIDIHLKSQVDSKIVNNNIYICAKKILEDFEKAIEYLKDYDSFQIYQIAQVVGELLGHELFDLYDFDDLPRVNNFQFDQTLMQKTDQDLVEFIKKVIIPDQRFKLKRKRFF
jgi:hypothetical protein